MTEQPGGYGLQDEGEALYQECQALLSKIRYKRLNIKMLKTAKHFLEMTLNYKQKKSK
jgi:hypothetical protein